MANYLRTQLITHDTERAAARHYDRLSAIYGTLISNFSNGPVLDIGPGRGELLTVLSANLSDGSSEIFSIDIDDEVARHIATSYPATTALHGDPIEILANEERKFEAIFILHVLEHLEVNYAIRLLTEIRRSLAPGGSVIMEVPNSACTFVGNTIYSSDITHKTPYTSVSLKQICRMAGFEDIEITGIRPTGSGPIRWIQRVMTSILIATDRLFHKIYLPSWKFLHEATIYAVCKKPLAPNQTPEKC